MMSEHIINPGSFRDPNGYIFCKDGKIFRHINERGIKDYQFLISSGLYDELVSRGWMVRHTEISREIVEGLTVSTVLEPEVVPFISYPYEWSFTQLKDAAILTLEIQSLALSYGMSLKDASAYNVQFLSGNPLLIDTLSLIRYEANSPWAAYRQYCQHFLAPLVLMSMKDINLAQMLKSYLDGLELHFVSKLLPIRSWFKLSIVLHIHLHAILDRIFSSYKQREVGKIKNEVVVSKRKLIAILDDIKSLVKKLNWSPIGTEWANYYKCNNYADSSFKSKKIIIEIFLREIKPTVVWDIGANTGYFSEVASSLGSLVISMDLDVAAVEMNYLKQKSEGNKLILPILMNITNPSPNLGWALQERYSLINRGPADCILALALIHHLALTHNIPLYKISNFFSLCSKYLIIEFIPKNDSKVVELLKNKIDSYYDYTQSDFVKYFSADFVIMEIHAIIGSNRTLFLMKSKRCQ